MTLSGATTLSQSGPGSDGNKGILCILQSSSITGTSPSDWLMLYTGHSLGESYPYTEIQSVYFTAPADWANRRKSKQNIGKKHLTRKAFFHSLPWHFNFYGLSDAKAILAGKLKWYYLINN